MTTDLAWNTYVARLASFEAAVPIPTKKKGPKAIAWPHNSPSPESLAKSGFYFKPSASSHDNTQCFLCEHALDGWTSEDDANEEHLKHSPECGWAIIQNVVQNELQPATMEDPTSERLSEARRATFKDLWPHDGKRGWHCKTEKMVDGGWHFAPTPESDDYASCAYCKLSLDGWEPKDSPRDEHYRRSPDCPFFTFESAAPATKGKRGRKSKASRLSTQSNLTNAPNVPSIPDLDDSIDGSILSVASVATNASTMGKQKQSKRKGKASRSSEVEVIEAPPPKTFIEDQHAAIIGESPVGRAKVIHGRKRGSHDISGEGRGDRESTVKPEPPPKRRNTRTRSSAVDQVAYPSLGAEPETMEVDHAQPKPARGGRNRASSQARKASAASTASLRAAIPDNATIEAALEADLDRLISDEETPAIVAVPKEPKGRKPKAPAASVAHMRAPPEMFVGVEIPQPAAHAPTSQEPETHSALHITDIESSAPTGSKSTKSKPPKRTAKKRATRTHGGSNESIVTIGTDVEPQVDSSMLTTRTDVDDSGHETDASVAGKSVIRKGSKRKVGGKGKGKKAGTGIMSKNIEDIIHPESQSQAVAESVAVTIPELEPELELKAAHAVSAEREVEYEEIDEPMPVAVSMAVEEETSQKPIKPTKMAGKAKSTKSKKAKAQERAPQLSMPGAFSPTMPDPDQDVEPSFASVVPPASPPVLHAMPVDQPAAPGIVSPTAASVPPQLPPRSPFRAIVPSARPTPTPQRSIQQYTQESTPSPSPQSSDAENAPPSSRPASTRPPLAPLSPSRHQGLMTMRVPLAPGTPRAVPLSPSKIGGGLRSEMPWTSVDVEMVFANTPALGKENVDNVSTFGMKEGTLTSPEKKMTVEEWINWNAQQAEEKLRAESERVVGVFEKEGGRALMALEGIEVTE